MVWTLLSRFSHVWLFVTPWTVTCQAPLSMGIFQARILACIAVPSSRGSSRPKHWTWVSRSPVLAGKFFTTSATLEAPVICLVKLTHDVNSHTECIILVWKQNRKGSSYCFAWYSYKLAFLLIYPWKRCAYIMETIQTATQISIIKILDLLTIVTPSGMTVFFVCVLLKYACAGVNLCVCVWRMLSQCIKIHRS